MKHQQILVVSAAADQEEKAQLFANQHNLSFLNPESLPGKNSRIQQLVLFFASERVELRTIGKGSPGPVYVDFVKGALAHRRLHGGGRGELISKAVGLRAGIHDLSVLDATAGLGRDSFVLASLGCRVTMIERQPIIHCLLEDGLTRAESDLEVAKVAARMTLQKNDSIEMLSESRTAKPDVIYLDPMFPDRTKSSLVKKEMRIFKQLVGDADADAAKLLERALALKPKRVVVKRPRHAASLPGAVPSLQLNGRSSRFDVYAISSLKSEG